MWDTVESSKKNFWELAITNKIRLHENISGKDDNLLVHGWAHMNTSGSNQLLRLEKLKTCPSLNLSLLFLQKNTLK